MTIQQLSALRQALLDNLAGHPLARIHAVALMALVDEAEAAIHRENDEMKKQTKDDTPDSA